MSIALSGVTFPWQHVSPSDDGVLYGAALTDGVLAGCAVSYSAASLIVDPGWLLIGTRQLRIPSRITVAVDGASSGYARLKISLDMTQTSTKEVFSQAYMDVEYSATIAGFPSLARQDINGSGTIYQAVLAVVTLGNAGITSIVETLPVSQVNPKMVNVTVPVSAWAADPESRYAGYGFRAAIANPLVTSMHYPLVSFDPTAPKSWIPDTYDGGLSLYSSVAPDEAVTIPAIAFVR